MKKKKWSILLLPVILAVSACNPGEAESDEELVRTVNVHLQEIQPESFSSYLRVVGTVVTSSDILISSEISGRIREVYKREGSQLQAGDAILKIDDERLVQEVRRQRSVTEQSRENYQRLERLYKNEGIGSEIEVLNTRFTFDQNQAALEALQVDLRNTSIKAPFDGDVEGILVETGERVAAGTPVVRMISRTGLKVRVGIPARYANVVDAGDEAEVWFDFDPETIHTLPITFVGSTIDPNNRTFQVDMELPPALESMKIDMLANVRVRTQHLPGVVVVSEEFVFRKNGVQVVYIAGENEQGETVAVERPVETGPSYGNQVVIQEGIESGDRLITAGASYLQDGIPISIVAESGQDNGTETS